MHGWYGGGGGGALKGRVEYILHQMNMSYIYHLRYKIVSIPYFPENKVIFILSSTPVPETGRALARRCISE